MCDPRLRLKVEFNHKPKDGDGYDPDAIEEGVLRAVGGADDAATDVRVSPGHKLSVVFVTLIPHIAQERRSLREHARRVVREMDRQNYAPEIELRGWKVQAVDAGDGGGVKDNPTPEEALDGLQNAAKFAQNCGWGELGYEISERFHRLSSLVVSHGMVREVPEPDDDLPEVEEIGD